MTTYQIFGVIFVLIIMSRITYWAIKSQDDFKDDFN